MDNTNIVYLVLKHEYLRSCGSPMRCIRWSRYFYDLQSALAYILNFNVEDPIVIPMEKEQFKKMYERNEKLCI